MILVECWYSDSFRTIIQRMVLQKKTALSKIWNYFKHTQLAWIPPLTPLKVSINQVNGNCVKWCILIKLCIWSNLSDHSELGSQQSRLEQGNKSRNRSTTKVLLEKSCFYCTYVFRMASKRCRNSIKLHFYCRTWCGISEIFWND